MKNQKGFTLVELLVVVAIVGILSAIAIPQFSEYKSQAFNTRAQADLRNAISAQESYFVNNEKYVSCTGQECGGINGALPGLVISEGVKIAFVAGGETGDKLFAASCHDHGNKIYDWSTESNIITNQNATCKDVPKPKEVE